MKEGLGKLAATDLNLLTVFRAVDEVRHVTKAAKLLGMSQPALSHALARLRQVFGDPLFVKASRGMVATPRAEALSQPIRDLLGVLERDILSGGVFEPSTLRRTFAVRATDLIESTLTPALLRRFATDAPQARFVMTLATTTLPAAELERGTCDLAIAGFFGELPAGLYKQKLFTDSFLCAVRRDHPVLGSKRKLTLDDYAAARHVLISPSGELASGVDAELRKVKRERTVVAGMSNFMVSGWIASRTDCLLTAPSRLLKQFEEPLRLRIFEPPLALPKITVVQVWHERNDRDPAHRWFRGLVLAAVQD